jgi:hypothetical protein
LNQAATASLDHSPQAPSARLRQTLKQALFALSLSNLCFIKAWLPLLYGSELAYYKQPVTSPSLLAMGVNLLWFAALILLAVWLRQRFPNRWFILACDCLFFLLLLLPLDACRRLALHIHPDAMLAFLKHPLVLAALALLAGAAVWQHRRLTRVATLVVAILTPLALFTSSRIVLLLLNVAHLAEPTSEPALSPPTAPRPGQPRVLWIIFDEMDYRLAFDERPAGVKLPEFDRLKSESLFATNAFPPGDATRISMPALISGKRVAAVTPSGASDLSVTLAAGGPAVLWSEMPSVFAAARKRGVNTALLGWFHPYRRVLHRGLNYCDWYPYPGSFPAQERTFSGAIVNQLGCFAQGLEGERLFANVCRAMLAESLSLATNSTYGLILLHLPPPHRPGIYLPDQDRFTSLSMPPVQGYFNNLVLADRWLGKLRTALELCEEWNDLWLIVSADHSWRFSRQYDHHRDLRIPLMIKSSRERTALTFSDRLNTVLTHDLILAILSGEVKTQAALAAWLESRSSAEPTSPGDATYRIE